MGVVVVLIGIIIVFCTCSIVMLILQCAFAVVAYAAWNHTLRYRLNNAADTLRSKVDNERRILECCIGKGKQESIANRDLLRTVMAGEPSKEEVKYHITKLCGQLDGIDEARSCQSELIGISSALFGAGALISPPGALIFAAGYALIWWLVTD